MKKNMKVCREWGAGWGLGLRLVGSWVDLGFWARHKGVWG